jgi:hypothetical protein
MTDKIATSATATPSNDKPADAAKDAPAVGAPAVQPVKSPDTVQPAPKA